MVKDLDNASFKTFIFDYDKGDDAPLLITKPTIIEFWATWCPHCQAMIPRYEKVSEDFPQIDCYRIELEQYPKLGNLFGVESFPTFVFISQNGDMDKWVGELSETDLATKVEEIFSIKPE